MTAVIDVAVGITPGAGYGCSPGRCVPGKRLRNWHRIHLGMESSLPESKQQRPSLREFARALVAIAASLDSLPSDRNRGVVAARWLASKGASVIASGSVRS